MLPCSQTCEDFLSKLSAVDDGIDVGNAEQSSVLAPSTEQHAPPGSPPSAAQQQAPTPIPAAESVTSPIREPTGSGSALVEDVTAPMDDVLAPMDDITAPIDQSP
mmetsp:Transcript_4479/g.8004  ORF Transcript_4479/g.8004 Transcript_4479/m.8004 type:complete len:105 (-) Transcript_4479:273-587(-)